MGWAWTIRRRCVARDRLPADPRGFARLAPDLAVEIVSPSNTVSEIQGKVFDYLDAGTRLVWVVSRGDGPSRSIARATTSGS